MHLETLSVGPFEVNCCLLWDDHSPEALVVDPGSEAEGLLKVLRRRHLRVAAYLLTHGHADHLGALPALCAAMPAPVVMHPADAAWAFTPVNSIPPYYPAVPRPAGITLLAADGERRNDAGLACQVWFTPGHTPGGVCYYFESRKLLLTGDTLFAGSVGRTDLPGGDERVLAASLERLCTLPDDTVIIPGHGPQSTLGREKRSNPFLAEV